MQDLSVFTQFINKDETRVSLVQSNDIVIYTRVSSREQALKNMSLDTQYKALTEFASANDLNVVESFGGTYESAKTDGRKEFQRMLK